MRTIVGNILLVVVAAPSVAAAQAPALMPVQGFLTQTSGTPVTGETSITFALYAEEAGGTPLFTETQTVLVEEGYFTAYVGDVATLDLATFRDNGTVYLGIQVGGDPEMSPRLQLATVPFAAVAQHVAAGGVDRAALASDALAASGTRGLSGSANGTTVVQMATFEVVAPGPGTLTVMVSGSAFVDCDATSGTSRICSTAAMGICDTTASSASCGGSFRSIWHEDPDDATTLNMEHHVTLVRAVPAAAAGPVRLYLNGRGPAAGSTLLMSADVVVVYTPGDALAINP
jgi:hypothetical protein